MTAFKIPRNSGKVSVTMRPGAGGDSGPSYAEAVAQEQRVEVEVKMAPAMFGLSRAELRVARLLLRMNELAVAEKLGRKLHTVQHHRRKIFRTLGVKDRAELAAVAGLEPVTLTVGFGKTKAP